MVERIVRTKRFPMACENVPVPARVGDEQDQAVESSVPALQLRSAIDSLDVTELRLGLDTDPRRSDRDHPIQPTWIARDGQRHLRSERQARWKSGAEPRQQAELAGVARRIVHRVGAEAQLIPDRRARKRQLLDCHSVELVALDSPKRGSMEADRGSRAGDAQADRDPRLSHIADDRGDRFSGAHPRPIPPSYVCGHCAESGSPHLSADYHGYDPAVRLIDSHCHLNAERFAGDEAAVLERAQAAGVERVLVPGWNVASCARALELVDRFSWLDASVGVHPHDAAKVDEAGWQSIVEQSRDPRVVAIGETGLDYDRVFSPVPDQLANLRRNLELALETGKPAILHVRSTAGRSDAQDATVDELRALGFGSQRSVDAFGTDRPPAVIHSFSGLVDYARKVLDLGLAISISGLAFRAGEEPTADVVPLVPADRLLVETDSPFLAPPGAPRARNEPEWVRITADWVDGRRHDPADAAGDALIRAYDRTFRARPR